MDTTKPLDPSQLFSAKDQVIVITGGGSGIGLAITASLANTSAKAIYILGRRLPTLESAASPYPNVHPLQCDITSPSSLSAAVSHIKSTTGYIDVLINNAGILGPSHTSAKTASSISELSQIMLSDISAWEQTFAINTTAVMSVSASFLPLLEAGNTRKGYEAGKVPDHTRARTLTSLPSDVDPSDTRTSQIITVSSIASFNRVVTAGFAYSSSKAGATHLAKMLATILAPWGIRSNVIAPGIFPSDMTVSSHGIEDWAPSVIPSGRLGAYEDVVGVALYLVGRAGAYANGVVQMPDGGRLSVHPASY